MVTHMSCQHVTVSVTQMEIKHNSQTFSWADLSMASCCTEETCGQCGEVYELDPSSSKYKLVDHCYKCSGKSRNVINSSSDKTVQTWFRNLRTNDPEAYKKILADADKAKTSVASTGSSGKLTSNCFNLAKYKESHNEIRGSRFSSEWKLLTFAWYKDGVCPRCWLDCCSFIHFISFHFISFYFISFHISYILQSKDILIHLNSISRLVKLVSIQSVIKTTQPKTLAAAGLVSEQSARGEATDEPRGSQCVGTCWAKISHRFLLTFDPQRTAHPIDSL